MSGTSNFFGPSYFETALTFDSTTRTKRPYSIYFDYKCTTFSYVLTYYIQLISLVVCIHRGSMWDLLLTYFITWQLYHNWWAKEMHILGVVEQTHFFLSKKCCFFTFVPYTCRIFFWHLDEWSSTFLTFRKQNCPTFVLYFEKRVNKRHGVFSGNKIRKAKNEHLNIVWQNLISL